MWQDKHMGVAVENYLVARLAHSVAVETYFVASLAHGVAVDASNTMRFLRPTLLQLGAWCGSVNLP